MLTWVTPQAQRRAAAEIAKLDRCLTDGVARFNALYHDAGVAAIVPKSRPGS